MKNREYFIKYDIYDILLNMQKNRGSCILDDLNNRPKYCICLSTADVENCEECLQRWLNEEYKGGMKNETKIKQT